MAFNITSDTQITGLSASYFPSSTQSIGIDRANNLGYGLGKLFRGVLDRLWARMQRTSTEPTHQKKFIIYNQGLMEAVQQINPALDRLSINPRDVSAFKKIQEIVQHYSRYLEPVQDSFLRESQRRILKPLEERIAQLAHSRLKIALSHLLPSLEFPGALPTIKRAIQSELFPATFNLTTLNGTNGFVVGGTTSNSVSGTGDLNRDGIDDLVLGVSYASSGAGSAYVLFGQTTGWTSLFDITNLNGTNGFVINGLASGDGLGCSVSGAGDLNHDGIGDLVLGADGTSLGGSAYVLFGKATGWNSPFYLPALNGANGFVVNGLAAGNSLGYSVSKAGDLNHDGIDDFVLGAPNAFSGAGSAYVLFGQMTGWTSPFNLGVLNGTNGFLVKGLVAGDSLGSSVSGAGDLNGDGIDDLVLGAPSTSFGGSAYVLLGQKTGWISPFNLTTLNGTNGFVVNGLSGTDFLGNSLSSAGDLNGDGIGDLALGAERTSYGGAPQAGAVYVLFGQMTGWISPFNLTTLNGTNGFLVKGLSANDELGSSITGTGDLNGDGIDDLAVGDPYTNTGSVYVLFGQTMAWTSPFDLLALNGTNGFEVGGTTTDNQLGHSLSGMGDFNGDGIADLVIGAYATSPYAAYVLFGLGTPVFSTPTSIQPTPPTPSGASQLSTMNPTSLLSSSTPFSMPTPPATSSVVAQSSTFGSTILPSKESANITASSFSLDETIGITAGVTIPIILGGAVGLVLLLRTKKKGCFAKQEEKSLDVDLDVDMGELSTSLFISSTDLEIKKKIAEGNFGDVYQGIYQNQKVAIKQLKGQLTPEAQAKLFDEIKIMAELRSHYIVSFFGVTQEQPYRIIMEYMEGGSLRDFLKKQAPENTPWRHRFQLGHDISQGLVYLHDHKIVHADLKSPNVLLNKKNRAKLADFGLATVKTENMEQFYQDAHQVKGSLLWMAPELFDQSRHTFPTDIYSLGVVLWEIATHRLPFQEKKWGVGELSAQITKGTPEKFPSETPKVYAEIAAKCWDGNPENRPTADAVAQVFTTLYKEDNKDYEEISVDAEPPYLTGTYDPTSGQHKPSYYEETKFGI